MKFTTHLVTPSFHTTFLPRIALTRKKLNSALVNYGQGVFSVIERKSVDR